MVGKLDRSVGMMSQATTLAADPSRDSARAGEPWARARARALALLAPEALPPGCERVVNDEQSKWYRMRLGAGVLSLVLEVEVWRGELWAHLVVTGREAAPSAIEIAYCRDLFFGERKAIQVLPRKLERMSSGDARAAHLYAPLESDGGVPSFVRAGAPTLPVEV